MRMYEHLESNYDVAYIGNSCEYLIQIMYNNIDIEFPHPDGLLNCVEYVDI